MREQDNLAGLLLAILVASTALLGMAVYQYHQEEPRTFLQVETDVWGGAQ